MEKRRYQLRPGRRQPAPGVRLDLGEPTVVLVTVCTKKRQRWLACPEAHQLLHEIWREADAWLAGRYVLMPDHLHVLAAPRNLQFTLERWLTFWKSRFSKRHSHDDWQWQTAAFHHRLRNTESVDQRWQYLRENPVRAGMVKNPDDWPYQGEVHTLRL